MNELMKFEDSPRTLETLDMWGSLWLRETRNMEKITDLENSAKYL